MEEAKKEKVTEEHNVIDEAIRDRGDGYTVFSIVSLVFRPSILVQAWHAAAVVRVDIRFIRLESLRCRI